MQRRLLPRPKMPTWDWITNANSFKANNDDGRTHSIDMNMGAEQRRPNFQNYDGFAVNQYISFKFLPKPAFLRPSRFEYSRTKFLS